MANTHTQYKSCAHGYVHINEALYTCELKKTLSISTQNNRCSWMGMWSFNVILACMHACNYLPPSQLPIFPPFLPSPCNAGRQECRSYYLLFSNFELTSPAYCHALLCSAAMNFGSGFRVLPSIHPSIDPSLSLHVETNRSMVLLHRWIASPFFHCFFSFRLLALSIPVGFQFPWFLTTVFLERYCWQHVSCKTGIN